MRLLPCLSSSLSIRNIEFPSLGVFAFPLIFLMTFMANLFYDQSDAIPAVLMSNWLYIHTPLVILGYAALFIAFSAAIMYLIQERELKSKQPSNAVSPFPFAGSL